LKNDFTLSNSTIKPAEKIKLWFAMLTCSGTAPHKQPSMSAARSMPYHTQIDIQVIFSFFTLMTEQQWLGKYKPCQQNMSLLDCKNYI